MYVWWHGKILCILDDNASYSASYYFGMEWASELQQKERKFTDQVQAAGLAMLKDVPFGSANKFEGVKPDLVLIQKVTLPTWATAPSM